MKLTEMIEKFAKQGMIHAGAKEQLLESAEETEGKLQEMQDALDGKDGELEESRKTAAVERAILEAGGRNVKAILALIDMEEVAFDGKKGLSGLDLEEVKAEAPYLFHEKTEKKKGTGVAKSSRKKKEDEIRDAFRKGLGR